MILILLYFAITLSFDLVNQLKTASKEFDLKEKQAESATAVIGSAGWGWRREQGILLHWKLMGWKVHFVTFSIYPLFSGTN